MPNSFLVNTIPLFVYPTLLYQINFHKLVKRVFQPPHVSVTWKCFAAAKSQGRKGNRSSILRFSKVVFSVSHYMQLFYEHISEKDTQ